MANKNNKKQNKANKKPQQEKSSDKNKSTSSCSCCKWVLGSLFLIALIGGVISYDVHHHGGKFERSATGKFLKQTGALPYVEVAWYKSMSASAKGYLWTEQNLPIFVNQTCTTLRPYALLAKDFGLLGVKVAGNAWTAATDLVAQKSPVVVNFIDQYAPGVPQKIQEFSFNTWSAIRSTSVNVFHNGCEFFKTKVFVGNFSPENLGKALNNTQVAAARYYKEFHDKVNAYAKLK